MVFHVSGTCALGFTLKEEGREGDRGKEEEMKRRKWEVITNK